MVRYVYVPVYDLYNTMEEEMRWRSSALSWLDEGQRSELLQRTLRRKKMQRGHRF